MVHGMKRLLLLLAFLFVPGYEDRETFSAWAGWNFATGTELELSVVPMVGAVLGQTQGWAHVPVR